MGNSVLRIALAFVMIIVGISLLSSVATSANAVTNKTVEINESHDLEANGCITGGAVGVNESNSACNITVTNYPSSWKIYDCPITVLKVHNETGGQEFVVNTDYRIFDTSGIIQMLNATNTNQSSANTTLVNYIYCADDYMNSSFGRSATNLIAGFFALSLIGIALGLFYGVLKEEGIINI